MKLKSVDTFIQESKNITESAGDTVKQEFNYKTAEINLAKEIDFTIGVKSGLKLEKPRGRGIVELSSNKNLHKNFKPQLFKTLELKDFGSDVTKDGKVWLRVTWRFEYLNNGFNGTDLCSVWFNLDGTIDNIKWDY